MVPEGWAQKEIGEVCSAIVDCVNKTAPVVEEPTPYKMIRTTNVRHGRVDTQNVRYVTEDTFKTWTRRGELKDNDIILTREAPVGEVGQLLNAAGMFLGQRTMVYRGNPKVIDQQFLFQAMISPSLQRQYHSDSAGGTVAHIRVPDCSKFILLVPPLPEQRKIADILSTWDAAIEKTEALLATAKAQKRALMQSLLTGKRRFPEFEGQPWKEVRLGEVGVISSAGVDKKIEDGQPKVRLLNFLDVFRREFIFDHELDHVVTAPPAKLEQCNVQRGDVFFTPSSETRDEIAIPAVAAEDMEGVCYSYHVVRFRLSEPWDLNFRAYVFQTDHFRRQAYKLGDGSGQRYVISQGNFRNMTVRVPSVAEQAKIGAVLKAASDEENELGSEITKLRTEKKALMQQLLTGKRRVMV